MEQRRRTRTLQMLIPLLENRFHRHRATLFPRRSIRRTHHHSRRNGKHDLVNTALCLHAIKDSGHIPSGHTLSAHTIRRPEKESQQFNPNPLPKPLHCPCGMAIFQGNFSEKRRLSSIGQPSIFLTAILSTRTNDPSLSSRLKKLFI